MSNYFTLQVSAVYDEPLRIELLQLATILLKYLPRDLVEHKQKLYKFGRNHLMEGDSASKQWAFVNVCHLLNAYDFPEESILEVEHIIYKSSRKFFSLEHIIYKVLEISFQSC
jgi:hypothetical protein